MGKRPKTTHVVPKPKGAGWNVKHGGATRASSHHNTQHEATKRARVISRKQGTELFVHSKDGRIARKDSHGGDPYPPKG